MVTSLRSHEPRQSRAAQSVPAIWAQTACDGCGQRLAARAARLVSYGPVTPHGLASTAPKIFHRPECAQAYWDGETIDAGLSGL